MADVRLSIASREYIVTCKDGEEPHLQTLGAMVDDMARTAGGASGGLNESRSLLFSALLLADKLHESNQSVLGMASANAVGPDANMEQTATMLEKLASRLETLADKLEQ